MNRKKIIRLGIGVIAIVIVVVTGILLYGHFTSDKYKLGKKGYTKEEITQIISLDKTKYNDVLTKDYNPTMLLFFAEKYYIESNLDGYLNYQKDNSDKSISEIITIINLGLDKGFYNNDLSADTSKEGLVLVNKFYKLNNDYIPGNLVKMNLQYAFTGKQLVQVAYNAFVNMAKAAKIEDITILGNTAYRSYDTQLSIYNNTVLKHDRDYADNYVARAGYSEHQTGLAIDIATYNTETSSYTNSNFETTPAFTWLSEHAYEYGYILRYPNGKEYITGYNYEPWHYRYVGIEAATFIHDNDLTFDEYYLYYVDGAYEN